MNSKEIRPIGHIYNNYKEKFGIPRQSGLVNSMVSKIIFEKEYRHPDYFRGLNDFSHIWLIWDFSEVNSDNISATVRPPKIDGNTRVGVFSTRSPFRPNTLGLSSVKIEKIENDKKYGSIIYVSGADLMDGTPIYDVKPYLPYTDIHNDATVGFALQDTYGTLDVVYPDNIFDDFPQEDREALIESLRHDPRPSYHNDGKIYTMSFGVYQIKFNVWNEKLHIIEINR